MTDETVVETPDLVTDIPAVAEGSATIADTKTQLAEMYLNFLDEQKGGIVGTTASLGININPLKKDTIQYLTSDTSVVEKSDIFSTIGKNLKKAVLEKVTGGTFLEYDQQALDKIDKMKTLILTNKDNQAKLQELMNQIQSGVDPTTVEVSAATASTTTVATNEAISDSQEKVSDRREAVLAKIAAVLKQDEIKEAGGENQGVNYTRGGDTSIEAGLDCGGLIVYCAKQAGLKIGGNGRELFQNFPSKKLEVNENGGIATDVSQFKEGDVLVFDSIDPAYYDTAKNKGRQHEITGSEGQKIHPHHFAFIKSFDREKGIVHIVESNGSKGVTESECSITKRLDEKQVGTKKSNLRAVQVNYDDLEKISSEALAKMEELPGSQTAA